MLLSLSLSLCPRAGDSLERTRRDSRHGEPALRPVRTRVDDLASVSMCKASALSTISIYLVAFYSQYTLMFTTQLARSSLY